MTEASHQMASNPLPPGARKPGSVGVADRRRDPHRRRRRPRLSPPGEAGEVVIRGPGRHGRLPQQPRGERRRRSSTAGSAPATAARFDADGYLRLEGRLKEMILRGGENISPYEIEEVLLAHPAVADAICFGIDDEKYGERVGAAVALARRRRRARADRPLPRAARRVQGARGRPRARRDPAHADRQGAAQARRRRALGGRRMRFAVLGAGAIGAYVGAALARGGSDVTLIARGAHLRAMQARRRAGAEPARRLRGASRGDRRPRRDRRRRRRRSSALKAYSLPGARAASSAPRSRPARP